MMIFRLLLSGHLSINPTNAPICTRARSPDQNRDQAKKSREKKKKAIESMQAELDESRKKLKVRE